MRTYKFQGTFRSAEGHIYTLSVICMSFFEAFFLLTADAIRSGKHYQLHSISKEGDSNLVFVEDIMKCSKLLS